MMNIIAQMGSKHDISLGLATHLGHVMSTYDELFSLMHLSHRCVSWAHMESVFSCGCDACQRLLGQSLFDLYYGKGPGQADELVPGLVVHVCQSLLHAIKPLVCDAASSSSPREAGGPSRGTPSSQAQDHPSTADDEDQAAQHADTGKNMHDVQATVQEEPQQAPGSTSTHTLEGDPVTGSTSQERLADGHARSKGARRNKPGSKPSRDNKSQQASQPGQWTVTFPQPSPAAAPSAKDVALGTHLHAGSCYWRVLAGCLKQLGDSISVSRPLQHTLSPATPASPLPLVATPGSTSHHIPAPTAAEQIQGCDQHRSKAPSIPSSTSQQPSNTSISQFAEAGECTIKVHISRQHISQVAGAIQQLLKVWFPRHVKHQLPHLAPPQLARRDAAMRATPARVIPPGRDGWQLEGVMELVSYVLGPGGDVPGACGLKYLHSVQWQPFNAQRPDGAGQLLLWCTDGCGVWMVVIIRTLGFVKVGKKRTASHVARNEQKRRGNRRSAMRTVLKEARSVRQVVGPDGVVLAVFSAMCLSLAEGLEVVCVHKGQPKLLEQELAAALIPRIEMQNAKQQALADAGAAALGPVFGASLHSARAQLADVAAKRPWSAPADWGPSSSWIVYGKSLIWVGAAAVAGAVVCGAYMRTRNGRNNLGSWWG